MPPFPPPARISMHDLAFSAHSDHYTGHQTQEGLSIRSSKMHCGNLELCSDAVAGNGRPCGVTSPVRVIRLGLPLGTAPTQASARMMVATSVNVRFLRRYIVHFWQDAARQFAARDDFVAVGGAG